MNFRQLQKISSPHHYGLTLDRFLPKTLRNIFRKLSAFLAILFFVLSFDTLPLYFGKADGMFFLCIIVYLVLSFLEVFYRSMINEGVHARISESLTVSSTPVDLSLSKVLFDTDEIDVTRALFETKIGKEIFLRLGIDQNTCHNFVFGSRAPIIASSLNLEGDPLRLVEYARAIYEVDKSLQSFLSSNSINQDEFLGAAAWVMQTEDRARRRERFWSRENLGVIPSIGKSWSYGVSTDLGKYGMPFLSPSELLLFDVENGYRDREVSLLESILERRSEANAIIIDDDESVSRDIVGRLLKRVQLGIALPAIEHKNIFDLDWNSLAASYKSRSEFEAELLKILDQSISAGNVILYIRDLSGLVSNVKAIGINLGSLIAPYLSSDALQIIASTTNTDFHFFIETNQGLMQSFERIIPDRVGVAASMPVLLEQVLSVEKQYKIIFTYPAVLAILNTADRFVTYGEMPGKALDLLFEIAPWAKSQKISLVKENDVLVFASEKTGIESGPIKEKEAERIEHLEELLHLRVVGQNEAVESIASAVRRSRLGIGNPKKPLASFLFIGPTGVGKTEASKALAESFFGDEKKMIRFDMSEYSEADALAQLVGDFPSNRNGLLANKVRDNPYSVLLLDEFEKASLDVRDLFLQILDEGIFTDAFGNQVNCRNLIIIATSNAGSDLIWEAIKAKKDLAKEKQNIINKIIEQKTFKPELLNRFDGLILFHPLQTDELRKIAVLGLQKLAKRLKEQNIEFVINDEVVDFLVAKGSDPQFGARAINRVIQDKIEDLVARKIVNGEAKSGSKIVFLKENLI